MPWIFIFFIVFSALEIGLFMLSGNLIGVLPTVLLIILTGAMGAYFSKKQGLKALQRFQQQLQAGQPPGYAILDGVCILIGGVFLLSPGFLTDIIGLLLLFPYTRKLFYPLLLKLAKKWLSRGNIIFFR